MDYQQQRRTMASSSSSSSSSTPKPIIIISITISLLLSILVLSTASNPTDPPPQPPIPSPWPPQFHSILFVNRSGSLQVVDLWYDWPNGRNFNIIQHQLAKLTYDLEWNNGTSFYYTLDSNRECKVVLFEVGILRPDWLDGANYLGRSYVDGFLCDGWEKADFIWYYQDVETKRPVHWVFHTGPQGPQPTVSKPRPTIQAPLHNPVSKTQHSWRPTEQGKPMTLGHVAVPEQATSADKDLQSYCHGTSPLMQPSQHLLRQHPSVGMAPPHPEQDEPRRKLSAGRSERQGQRNDYQRI